MDHYQKASDYLVKVEYALKEFDKLAKQGVELPVHQLNNTYQAVDRFIALAHAHATLAGVQR